MNLYLIGGRGSGKSTIGPLIAQRLGWEFLDLDEQIVQAAGCTIGDIFTNEGEEGFRRREKAAFQRIRKLNRRVVSLGGGTMMDPENRALLKRTDKVVWLHAPAAVLWSRIRQDPATAQNRPNLTTQGGLAELEAILSQRAPVYQAVANHTIDTLSLTPDAIAEAIAIWYLAKDD